MNPADFNNIFGDSDIFLIDYILKGIVKNEGKILDAGCGSGRNLVFFLQSGYDITGVDSNELEVRTTNLLSRSLGKGDIAIEMDIKRLHLKNDLFSFILCSRVLHFCENQADFEQKLSELSRVCKPDGHIYLSMSSILGFDNYITLDNGKIQCPNGDVRFPITNIRLKYIESVFEIQDYRTVHFGSHHAESTLLLQPR